ncbi:hypothetical protein G6K67_002254 [Salmonella enterica subsp. enterica serovar Rubislaw]|nr:hypothetical protein [Salmonella enterica subsp. enterica serovar Rubislaw]
MLAQSVPLKASMEGKLRVFTSGLGENLAGDWYFRKIYAEKLSVMRDDLIRIMHIFVARMEFGSALLSEVEASNEIVSDEVLYLFEVEQDNLRSFYSRLTEQEKAFVAECHQLNNNDLPKVYADTLNMAKALFDMLEKMRWLIEEHNIDCGPRGEGNLLSSPEEIDAWFASL